MLPEVTSSGLSHTQADFFPTPAGNMRWMSLQDSWASEIYLDYNYGNLDINKVIDIKDYKDYSAIAL